MRTSIEPGPALLASAVLERRNWLDLDQDELKARGGPGAVTVRNIEKGRASPSRETLRGLDRALGWEPGTSRVLVGDAPLPSGGDADWFYELAITRGLEVAEVEDPPDFGRSLLMQAASTAYDRIVLGQVDQAVTSLGDMARMVAAYVQSGEALVRARPIDFDMAHPGSVGDRRRRMTDNHEETNDDRDAAPTNQAAGSAASAATDEPLGAEAEPQPTPGSGASTEPMEGPQRVQQRPRRRSSTGSRADGHTVKDT